MTSLIERLRAADNPNAVRSMGELWNLCDEAADALVQARELIELLNTPFYGSYQQKAQAWLRLIDGEQEKEG